MLSLSAMSRCESSDVHQIYFGGHWTHLSNFDAGPGYNSKPEDSSDHYGVDVEYQYHLNDQYFFASFGVGHTVVRTNQQEGWSCSGCSFPTSIRVGYKVRIN
jgi:hypothetical protein